ncbi:MAG: hypothetical protein AB8G05_20815 [Oligoflexales bacterium]
MSFTFKWIILVLFFLNACDSSNFIDGQTSKKSEKKSEDLLAEGEMTQEEVSSEEKEEKDPLPEENKVEPPKEEEPKEDPEEKPEFTDSVQEFTYGDPNPQVDYLFIIDNSVSMNAILDKVNLGFSSILQDTSIFSNDSKVAVMSTMIGQLGENGNLNTISDLVKPYNGIELEPGFLSLVDYDSYLEYISSQVVPQNMKDRWALPPCTEQWFSPTQTHQDGHYCFEAASQISASALAVEAGIKSFEQLLKKNQMTPLFRDGAIVNVIFVSDTHDPGRNTDQAYLDSLLDYAAFKEKLNLIQPVVDLKFHAIAPVNEDECGNEKLWDLSYFTLAQASKGQTGDACLLDDYRELMKNLIANGKIASPSFKLEATPVDMPEVHVNDEKITDFEYNEETLTVTIPSLDPYKQAAVAILYKVLYAN